MFLSKRRPIATPQAEHQKLAGTLALLWGNAAFERPPIALESFVLGIGLHDRAYGPLDNLAIGELAEAEWLALTRSGFEASCTDPVADLITRMHLHRLLSSGTAPARQALGTEMAQAIQRQLEQHGFHASLFERIDRITRLCDNIAFDFCFETPAQGSVPIYPKNDGEETVEVSYSIKNGTIQVSPWPFALDSYAGYLIAYQRDGYPSVLEPVLLAYRLMRED